MQVTVNNLKIIIEGQCHLGALIASQEYKDQYCEKKVRAWKEEIERLSEIAKSQPHAAYIAFTKGYKSKFTYFMRTIESFEVYVDPIQEVIEDFVRKIQTHRALFGHLFFKHTLCHSSQGRAREKNRTVLIYQ